MKKILFGFLFLLHQLWVFSQTSLVLTLHVDTIQTPIRFGGQLLVKADLKNVSNQPLKISQPTPYVLWKMDELLWNIQLNGKPIRPRQFVERPDRKYAKKDKITLEPNQSIPVAVYTHTMSEQGKLTFQLKYSQTKSRADEAYVSANLLKDRLDFEASSNELTFQIVKPVCKLQPLLSNEALEKQNEYSLTYAPEVTSNPILVRRLDVMEYADLQQAKDLCNLQSLKIVRKGQEATFPDFTTQWSLTHLSFFGTNVNLKTVFPPQFAQTATMRWVELGAMGDVNQNQIPEWVFQQPQLEHLQLRMLYVKTLDKRIFEFKNLKFLSMTIKSEIPDAIKNLNTLEEVQLSIWMKVDLKVLESLPNLKKLNVAMSRLEQNEPVLQRLKEKGVDVRFSRLPDE